MQYGKAVLQGTYIDVKTSKHQELFSVWTNKESHGKAGKICWYLLDDMILY
jgi:hypothetical protein